VGLLLAVAAGAMAQDAAPPAPAAASRAKPAAKAAANPNVVVLRSDTKWWNDAALSQPISLTLKAADARAGVAALASAAKLPMSVVTPPAPRVASPPAAAAAPARGAVPTAAPAPPAPPTATLEVKDKPVRDVMRSLAEIYHLSWHKEGTAYVLRDDSFRPPAPAAAQRPAYNSNNRGGNGAYNRNNRRNGPSQRAPGVYRQQQQRRRYR
jgi:hypothetical protein